MVGVVILVIAATSLARALERSLRAIWHAPSVSIRFAWRWFVVIGLIMVGLAALVAMRTVLIDAGLVPLLEFAMEASVWSGLWWIACWIAVNRRVSLRKLLPGALLAGIGFAVAGQIGRVLLPRLLADAAGRFGVLGMAFTYIGWLLVLASILLISAVIGRVAYLTYAGTAWSRSSNQAVR
ncbi:hypothetical protein ACFT30_10495 [Microbacterium ureisolvens]|uniref:hypothetical protein n=1 Tax=Microbacterium ureisolvens TaxID=2781186 RepID=UPI00363B2F40